MIKVVHFRINSPNHCSPNWAMCDSKINVFRIIAPLGTDELKEVTCNNCKKLLGEIKR